MNVDKRSLKKSFLGRVWGLPFGIAPMGMCNLAWPGTDDMLAAAAVEHNIPLALSTMASSTLEDISKQAGQNAWFQLYVGQSEALAMELISRAEVAGADGADGVKRVIDLLSHEISVTLAQLGRQNIEDIDRTVVVGEGSSK